MLRKPQIAQDVDLREAETDHILSIANDGQMVSYGTCDNKIDNSTQTSTKARQKKNERKSFKN